MKTIRFGIIGCGLMGREFASAAARWSHLLDPPGRPEIVAICDANPDLFGWYQGNFGKIALATTDYKELLASADVDAVYCAVPHMLHREIYVATLEAGKHLLGEKPFGIDQADNAAINAAIAAHPELIVRCASEFPYFPGAQALARFVASGALGRILEVNAGFLHSSDLNPDKPINWKRMTSMNGAYGCMGDLGMHVAHLPFRFGWFPDRVYAQLADVVRERPDGRGGMAPCDTWDNATLHCDVPHDGYRFPMTLKTWRMAPGEMNTWYIEALGDRGGARFSTKRPKTFEYLHYEAGGAQVWQSEDVGYAPPHGCITGGIFEFGFTDAILQMWAAYIAELCGAGAPFPCVSPEEAARSHALFTAALASHRDRAAAPVETP